MKMLKWQVTIPLALLILLTLARSQAVFGEDASPFHLAVSKGQIDNVKLALAKDANLANRRDERDFTPLFLASMHGHTAIAKLLLDRAAKVDDVVLGETPLFRACFQGHADTARLLLDRGARIDASNKEGLTPLFVAVKRVHKDAVRVLLDKGANPNPQPAALDRDVVHIPLLEAAQTVGGSMHSMKEFAKKGDQVNAKRQERQLKDAEEIARLLIACKKTDLNVKHPRGGAALHRIAAAGHVELAKLLLARGADVDVRTNPSQRRSQPPYDETPLHLAVRAGQEEMVALLLKHGANRNARNNRGKTPFELMPR